MIQLTISVFMLIVFAIFHTTRRVRILRRHESTDESTTLSKQQPNSSVSISFLVPAWNAADAIPLFVQSFNNLAIESKQLILCAGGSDGSFLTAKGYGSEDILVLEQLPGMGKQRALRESFPHATGGIIFLTDIDCQVENDMVLRMISEMSNTRTVVTGGIRPLQKEQTPLVTLQWAIRRCSSPNEVCPTNGLLGANTAIFKSTLEAIGGFSVNAQSGTDYTLAKEIMAKGYEIWYVPHCEMATEFPETLTTYIHKQSRWLRNVLVIGPRYHAWSELRSIAITLLLPYICGILLLGGFFLPVLWSVLALLLAHATANRMHYVSLSQQWVPVYSAFASVLGDIAAAIQAGYQWLFRRYVW